MRALRAISGYGQANARLEIVVSDKFMSSVTDAVSGADTVWAAATHQPRGARHADAHFAVVAHLQAAVYGRLQDAVSVAHLQQVRTALMSDLDLRPKATT